jgi:putative endonuclease
MWIIYLIQHVGDKRSYIGITDNLNRRLKEHNTNRNKSTISKQGEWLLVYAEAYRDKRDAILREKRLKNHGSGKHELVKRLFYSKL